VQWAVAGEESKMTISPATWHTLYNDLRLNDNEAHIWRANLNLPAAHIEQLGQLLAPDEHERAQQFNLDRHRRRYIVGRGLLRKVLSMYLEIDPRSVEFNYTPRGKMSLKHQPSFGKLFFNLSHSHELVLYSIAPCPLVGIDLEQIRLKAKIDDMASRYFFPNEYNKIRAMSSDKKSKIFFTYWTCKEAYLKATGVGLADLEKVEVLMHDRGISLRIVDESSQDGEDWFVQQINPQDGYVAALVLRGHQWQMKYFSCHW
jgi:4'-phosphopantetheinyl transferase